MILREVEIRGYRSLREVWFRPRRLTVLVGPNGVGKTNLYRSLRVLHDAAQGRLGRAIASEGGLQAAIWAGRIPKKYQRQISWSMTFDEHRYQLTLGFPDYALKDTGEVFDTDPVVKTETIELRVGKKWVPVATRRQSFTELMDVDGHRHTAQRMVLFSEAMIGELREPDRYPVLWQMHDALARWRFYHEFRTDPVAPARQASAITMTPVVATDGADLGAAMLTIDRSEHAGFAKELLAEAFPDGEFLWENLDEIPRAAAHMYSKTVKRTFGPHELSDGTIRFLCLVAALLSPKPPPLMVLNEPETSLHPDLLPSLARLIDRASEQCQVLLTTHSEPLARLLTDLSGIDPIRLERDADGATVIHRDRDE